MALDLDLATVRQARHVHACLRGLRLLIGVRLCRKVHQRTSRLRSALSSINYALATERRFLLQVQGVAFTLLPLSRKTTGLAHETRPL